MMLLHLLLHVLIFHLLTAKGGPRDSDKGYEKTAKLPARDINYVIKYREQCPDVGYYFSREASPNSIEPGPCYLCFCHGAHKAVCWRRENKRCNVESFHYRGFGKRDVPVPSDSVDGRVRRSPSFTDIFFRDASRDVFNKNTEPGQCKPYESSFSDDCPPADWCTGCTVCDCDANGRWDCHILSFCSDDKKGKNKGRKGSDRKTVKKKPVPKTGPTKPTTAPKAQSSKHSKNKKNPVNANHVFKKPSAMKGKSQKKKPSIRYQKISPKAYTTRSVKFIKKNVATHNPIEIMGNKMQKLVKRHQNNTVYIAQQVVKKVMSAVRQMVQKELLNMTMIATGSKKPPVQDKTKAVNKSGDKPKSNNKSKPKPKTPGKKVNKRQVKAPSPKIRATPLIWQRRFKRSLILDDIAATVTTNTTTMITEGAKPIENPVKPATSTSSPISVNLLAPSTQTLTVPPGSTIARSNEYYKYILATEKIPDIISYKFNEIDSNLQNERTNRSEESVLERRESKYMENNLLTNKIKEDVIYKTNIPKDINQVRINVLNPITTTVRNDIELDNHLKHLVETDAEDNYLKFNKWPQYILRQKSIPITIEKSKNILKLKANNSIEREDYKNKVRGKDIDRIPVTRKYNIVKIRNRNRCPFLDNYLNIVNTTNAGTRRKKIGLQDILGELLKEYNNNTKKASNKLQKFSVIRYLKKMFTSIFRRQNNSERFSRNHIIETLCANFGPCKVEVKNKVLLKTKLAEVDREAIIILKTVKIIKGLLKLLNKPGSNNGRKSSRENFRNDMHKLNSILKDNYTNYFKDSLSVTQTTQIDYIKKNADDFVRSVSKFAVLLNEIVTILTQGDNTSDINNKKLVQANKRIIKKDTFQTLKALFSKYNLVQNNFMKNIYDTLNNYDTKVHEKSKVSAVQGMNSSIAIENYSRNILKNLRKLSHLSQTLNSRGRTKRETREDAIEYLLMLMEYLLKQNHPLDAAPVNDGIDLLIDAIKSAPDIKSIRKKVLDNTLSPELETAHYYTQTPIYGRRSTERSYSKTNESNGESLAVNSSERLNISENELKMEGNRDIFEMVEEDKDVEEKFQFDRRAEMNTYFITNASTETSTTPEFVGNEVDMSINKGTTIKVSPDQLNYYNGDVIENANIGSQDKATIYSFNTDTSNTENKINDIEDFFNGKFERGNNNYNGYIYSDITESTITINDNIENGNNIIDNNINNNNDQYFTTTKSSIDDNRRYFDTVVVTDSNPIDFIQQEHSQNTENNEVKTFVPLYSEHVEERIASMLEPKPTNNTSKESLKPSQNSKSVEVKTLDSFDSDSLDKRAKLEWIEENFGREEKNYEEKNNSDQSINKTIEVTSSRTEVTWNQQNTPKLDVSSMSSEGKESNKNKINTDELMLKKQMDLLNSLDYGTERGELDEIDSKDTGERFSDAFSTYYV